MIDTKKIDELVQKLGSAVPPGVKEVQSELEKKFKEILTTSFKQLDLVTRDEFDVQAKVLLRTREKLEALEKAIKALEEQ